MKNTKLFYRICAIASIVTAVTTFLLWLLPRLYTAPTAFEQQATLAGNVYYMLKQWINFFHIPLALTAYFGLAYKLRDRELPKVSLGMIWFIIWGVIEMTGISAIIFTINKNWRSNYSLADETQKLILKTNIESFYAIWDSMFFVLLIAFLLATCFYGWATWKGKGLEKLLSYLFWLAALLTFLIILSGYTNTSNWAFPIIAWIYPVLQPFSRLILGIYLWRCAKE